jgi:hypothetical protein
MDHKEHPGASASGIAAARLLLQKMGIDPADLLQDPAGPSEIPTFADYIPRVSQAVDDRTRRVYSTYWNRIVDAWGPRLITSVSPLEISQLGQDIKTDVTPRRNARGGQGAAEHLIGALRCMYNHAVADRILSEAENPAARAQAAQAAQRPHGPARQPTLRNLRRRRVHRQRPSPRLTHHPTAHGNRVPTRRRPLPHPGRPRSRAMPDRTAREGRHGTLAAGFPNADGPSALPRGNQRRPAVPGAPASPRPASRSHPAATTTSGTDSASTCHGSRLSRSAPTGCSTPS